MTLLALAGVAAALAAAAALAVLWTAFAIAAFVTLPPTPRGSRPRGRAGAGMTTASRTAILDVPA